MSVPIEEKPSARIQLTPTVSGTSKTIIAVNGANSAGSRKVCPRDNTTNSRGEFTRFDINTSTECIVTILMQYGYLTADTKQSEPWHVRVTFDTDGDEDAFANIARGYPDIRTVTPELPFKAILPSGVTSVYVCGITATGATLAKCIGDIIIEVN